MSETAETEFVTLPQFPRYRIGSDGSVFSERARRRLRPIAMGNYLGLQLVDRDGRLRHRYMHRLVLEAFVGPPGLGMEARHLNGDRYDNRIANLRWGTALENAADKRLHGTSSSGARNGQSKLTPDLVLQIRRRAADGEMQRAIAAELRVSPMTVSRVVRRESWVSV